jgi:hypothetical protein
MLKPEIKQKWVTHLKSGEYKKGKGYLHKDDTYCCLGVLCDLYQKETGHGAWTSIRNSDTCVPFEYQRFVPDALNGCSTTLPTAVSAWAGLPEYDFTVEIRDTRPPFDSEISSLSTVNDTTDDFETVIQYIEAPVIS